MNVSEIKIGSTGIETLLLESAVLDCFRHHRFQSLEVMPGTACVSAVASVFQASGLQVHSLQQIEFKSILMLTGREDETLAMEIHVSRTGDTEFTASCQTRDATDAIVEHANMRVFTSDKPVAPDTAHAAPADQTGPVFTKEQIYAKLETCGNQYSGSFRGLRSAQVSPGHCTAAIEVAEDEAIAAAGFSVNPVLLDACIQTQCVLGWDLGRTFVLESIDRVVFAQALPGMLTATASHTAVAGSKFAGSLDGNTGATYAHDSAGVPCLSMTGVTYRYMAYQDAAFDGGQASSDEPSDNLVISATFTAEPLEQSLKFVSTKLGMRVNTGYAPFNQVFQQLLDPASDLASNQRGLNVTAVRLEDWAQDLAVSANASRGQATSSVASDASKAALPEDMETFALPNGLTVAHVNEYETQYLYSEIFADRCYLRHGISLENAACVIDIGANIGMFSMFVQHQSPGAKVYSFEPGAAVFDALTYNTQLINNNVVVSNEGVSDAIGEAVFTYYDNSTVFSTFEADDAADHEAIRAVIENMVQQGADIPDEKASTDEGVKQVVDDLLEQRLVSKSMTVQLTTISDIIEQNSIDKIDLLKVDAEKSELKILRGIKPEHWDRISQVVIEVHDKEGPVIKEVLGLLDKHGFDHQLTEEELLEDSGLFNIYAVKKSEKLLVVEESLLSNTDRHRISTATDDFIDAVGSFSALSTLPHIVAICPPSEKLRNNQSDHQFLTDIEGRINQAISDVKHVSLLDATALLGKYQVNDYYSAIGDQEGRVPYTRDFYSALGTELVRNYHLHLRAPFKVVVLDCDNTLWKGVCGEVGPSGVELDDSRKFLQTFTKSLISKGMLLCLCSKNVEQDVRSTFNENPAFPLAWDDIVASRINWEPKSQNLVSLAAELNLGLDSFIFIDDNPVECAEVSAACPSVLTLQLPENDTDIRPFIEHIWAFDTAEATDEAARRTQLYQENTQREGFRQSTNTLRDFIEKLELSIAISPLDQKSLPRVADLTNRTNQFNASTIRRSEADVQEAVKNQQLQAYTVNVSDRFGDYGLVGVLLLKPEEDSLLVDTLLLSCRVLGRGVEHQLVAFAGSLAQQQGKQWLNIGYQQTPKNVPVRKFLDDIYGEAIALDEDDRAVYSLAATDAAAVSLSLDDKPAQVSDTTGAKPVNMATVVAPAESSHPLVDYVSIALEMHSAGKISSLSESVSNSRARPELAVLFVAPRSPMETSLATLWSKILGISGVGVEDNFFDLGGSSLKAVQLVARCKQDLGLELPIVTVFADPTIAAIARELDSANDSTVSGDPDVRKKRERSTYKRKRSASR